MPDRLYIIISGSIFAAVALLHLVRAIVGIPVRIGDVSVPKGMSWAGCIAAALLSAWAFLLAAR